MLSGRRSRWASALAGILLAVGGADAGDAALDIITWDTLPSLPDPLGVAGPFAGLSGDALIVAGGANFPEGAPWDGHPKVWHDTVLVLSTPEGTWTQVDDTLPRPLAYGVSVTTADGLVCLGGTDGDACSRDVFVLRWDPDGRRVTRDETIRPPRGRDEARAVLPDLPVPLAFMSGARVDDAIYLAGGQETMGATARSASHVLRLDLAKDARAWAWEPLEWPRGAASRVLAVTAGQSDGIETAFYMFSGRRVEPPDAAELLTDAWRYEPGREQWTRLADTPRCVMAGAAAPLGPGHILVMGGDDGRDWGRDLRDRHPGFARDMLFAYHTITDTWTPAGSLPANHVTTTAVPWHDTIVIPSGEIRPGVRSPAVLRATPERRLAGLHPLDLVTIAIYLAALIAMGVYFARRERTTRDFFLAGRRVPWWAAGISIFGTQLSAITFMAIPALVYRTNWVYFVGQLTIVAAAPVIVWIYLPFFRRLDVTTAYEYLERRFNVAVRLLGSGAFLLFQLGRMGIVLYLPALALSTVTGLDVVVCIVLMGVMATIYTALGGIEAVIWTDVLQVVVLLGGAGLSLVVIAGRLDGGLAAVLTDGAAAGKLHVVNLGWDVASTALWVVVIGNLFFQLVPYTADQSVVQRYLTTADERRAARSIWTNAVLTIPASLLFYVLGTALWAFYRAHPAELNPLSRPDDILPWFIARELPIGATGLVIAGLFAASMSSLDSSMNSMATALTTDFYRRFRPRATDRRCLRIARLLTILLGGLGTASAVIMAFMQSTSMLDQYIKVVGLFGGGLAGLFAVGILTRRATGPGVIFGFFVSAIVLALVQRTGGVHFFLYAGIGLVTCFVVGYVASLVLPAQRGSLEGLTLAKGD